MVKVNMPEKSKPEVKRDDGVELETQFVLRVVPEEPAKALREAIQTGANSLKDRFSIKLEHDLRYGEVRFDHWLLHAKIVDLPTVIESLKTIDNKSFYKTADICQIMICKDEPDLPSTEDESPNKYKKKDPNKVDKKYLWPHGITPPCKNIRKRRFRKTLKKKYVEAPEIEKEVKRLLKSDNEANTIKFDIINEDDEQSKSSTIGQSEEIIEQEEKRPSSSKHSEKTVKKDISIESSTSENPSTSQIPRGVGEHDIFGEEVSSSEEEDNNVNVMDMEETSRLSADDSRISDFSLSASNVDKMITEFNKSMFSSPHRNTDNQNTSHRSQDTTRGFYEQQDRHESDDNEFPEQQLSRDQINSKILELRKQSDDLKNQQSQKAQEISSIQNPTLRQRMQETLDNILSQIVEKEMEIQDFQNML